MSAGMRNVHLDVDGPVFPNGEDNDTNLKTDEKRAPKQNIPIYNELELVSENDLSLGSILKGTAARPLTNFEKKAALING